MKNPLSIRCKSFAGLLLAVGSLTSLIVPEARANLILNSSFESPVVGVNAITFSTLPTSWTQAGPILPAIFNGTVSGWPSPQSGSQFVDIGNTSFNGAISQGFSVTTGGSYLLTWFDNAQISTGSAYTVEVLDSSSAVVATDSHIFIGASSWQSRSLMMTLGLGSYTLKFKPSQSTFDTLLDNVSLDAVGVVPEASTITAGALLLLPLGASTLRILRKRQVA